MCEYLVPPVAKTDTCGVGPTSTLVGVDEAGMGWSHLQHRLSPDMLIFGTTCTRPAALTAITVDDADVLLAALCSSTQRTCMIMRVWALQLA